MTSFEHGSSPVFPRSTSICINSRWVVLLAHTFYSLLVWTFHHHQQRSSIRAEHTFKVTEFNGTLKCLLVDDVAGLQARGIRTLPTWQLRAVLHLTCPTKSLP